MKTNTIDEVCNQPHGTFKKFIAWKENVIRQVEENRKARIRAARNNQPLPSLGFEVELWMLA